MTPLRAAVEITAIVACFMLALVFFAWALDKTFPEGPRTSLDITAGLSNGQTVD